MSAALYAMYIRCLVKVRGIGEEYDYWSATCIHGLYSNFLGFFSVCKPTECNKFLVHLTKQKGSLLTSILLFVQRHLQSKCCTQSTVQSLKFCCLKSQERRVRRCGDKRVYLRTSNWLQFKEGVSQCFFTVGIWPKFCRGRYALKFEIRRGNFYFSI